MNDPDRPDCNDRCYGEPCVHLAPPMPEGPGESAEVAINFEPDDLGIKVTAVLGEASIVVQHSWGGGAHDAATLVQALPNILSAVQAELESQEEA